MHFTDYSFLFHIPFYRNVSPTLGKLTMAWEDCFSAYERECRPDFLMEVGDELIRLSMQQHLNADELFIKTKYLRLEYDAKMTKFREIFRWAHTGVRGPPTNRGEVLYLQFYYAYMGPPHLLDKYVAPLGLFRTVVDDIWSGDYYWGM
jgi:hypothetical protein